MPRGHTVSHQVVKDKAAVLRRLKLCVKFTFKKKNQLKGNKADTNVFFNVQTENLYGTDR